MIVESCGVTLRMVDAEIFMFYFPLLNLGPIFFHQLKDLWLNRASKNAQGVKTHMQSWTDAMGLVLAVVKEKTVGKLLYHIVRYALVKLIFATFNISPDLIT